MKTKRDKTAEAVGHFLGLFLNPLIAMFALHLLHRDDHAIPALGYWSIFWASTAVVFTVTLTGRAIKRES